MLSVNIYNALDSEDNSTFEKYLGLSIQILSFLEDGQILNIWGPLWQSNLLGFPDNDDISKLRHTFGRFWICEDIEQKNEHNSHMTYIRNGKILSLFIKLGNQKSI